VNKRLVKMYVRESFSYAGISRHDMAFRLIGQGKVFSSHSQCIFGLLWLALVLISCPPPPPTHSLEKRFSCLLRYIVRMMVRVAKNDESLARPDDDTR